MGRHRLLLVALAASLLAPGPAGALTNTPLDDGNSTGETTLDGNATTNTTIVDGNGTLDDGNATVNETTGNASGEADCGVDGCTVNVTAGNATVNETASGNGTAADAPASGQVSLDCLVHPGDADCRVDASGEAGDSIVEEAWALAAELRCRTGGSGLPCQGNATADPGSTPDIVDTLKDVCVLGTCLF